jgi:hypothetical protein
VVANPVCDDVDSNADQWSREVVLGVNLSGTYDEHVNAVRGGLPPVSI